MQPLPTPRPRPAALRALLTAAAVLFAGACSESITGEDTDPFEEPTTGRVAFWTDVPGLVPITVRLGSGTATISSAHAAPPSCGDSGAATLTLAPGTHAYDASNAGGVSWEGTVEVVAGGCLRMRLYAEVGGGPGGPQAPQEPEAPSGPVDFTTPSTYFIDQSSSFSQRGQWFSQEFTLSATQTLVLRFVSDYAADAAIVTPDQLSAFTSGQSYRGYALFDGQYGTASATLPAGTYYLVVRNESDGSNRYRAEVDLDIVLEREQGYSFSYVDTYISGTESVAAGGWFVHSFTVQTGYRYLLDGANVGLGAFVIPAGEVENFKARRTFNYYEDYGGDDGAYPGLWEIELPPGTYYLAIRNEESKANPVTYTMERWRVQ